MKINGKIINSTVTKPYTPNLKTIVGLNINNILPPAVAKNFFKKMHQALKTGVCQLLKYYIEEHHMVAVMVKSSETGVVIHQACIDHKDPKRIKRLLLASVKQTTMDSVSLIKKS